MKYNKNKLRHQVTQYKRDILNKKSGKLSNNSKIKISRKNNNITHNFLKDKKSFNPPGLTGPF